MATNELQARITADISGLESGLKKAQKLQDDYGKAIAKTQNEIAQNIQISKGYERAIEQLNNELKDGTISQKQYQKQLQRLQRDEKETQIDTANLRKELNRLKRDQKDLASTSTKTTKGMTSFGKSTANATPSVIEFSRVIQDAPYGIQGVANNIQQLTTNFGYLRTQAGGTVPALKAFAGSFLGPAGIVFAVSTITSLLVTYGDELLSSVGSTNKLAKATAEFLGDAQAEIVTLRTLVGIAQDKSQSDQVRAQAVEELNDKYGDYLGNLTLEEIGTNAVNDSVQRLTRSLIKQAQVRGLEARIQEITGENSEDLIDKQLELSDAYKDLGRQTRELLKTNAIFRDRISEGLGTDELVKEIVRVSKALNIPPPIGIVQAVGRVNDLNQEVKGLKKETEQALTPIQELLSSVTADKLLLDSQAVDAVEDVVVTLDEYKKKQSEILKDSKKLQELYDSISKDIEDASLGEEAAQNLYDANQIAKELGSTAKDLSSLGGLDFDPQQGIPKTIQELEKVESLISRIAKSFPEIDTSGLGAFNSEQLTNYINQLNRAKETTQLFANAAGSAFSSFGQSIAQSFQTGNAALDAFIGSLVNGLTQILTQLLTAQIAKSLVAKKDIATQQGVSSANAVTIASSAAAALGPIGIGAFPALLASQLALVNGAFAPLYAFASGGIVPGGSFQGDRVPALLNSKEMVLNAGQQANLFGILNGNLASLQGQSAGSDIVGEIVLRGQNQLVQLKRTEKKFKRYYNS